ncbi:MAG: hypothetical protein QOC92_1340 [Acidimicrobiaceae bacterium]|jgi:hypothetical protein
MSELDELASAYLDDEVTPQERARVESDAALRQRVEELRAARDALSSEPLEPPSAATREAAIRAALGASIVVDIESRRARRGLRVASIAAAVLLVLGAAGLLIRAQSDTTADRFTTAAGPPATTAVGPLAERSAGGAAGAAATAGDAAGPFSSRSALGTFADRPALVAAAQARARDSKQAPPSTPPTQNNGASTTCVVPQPPDATGEVYAATAILAGQSVQVDVFTITDGSLRLVVTDAASCTQLFSQPV